jgi:hypothetical protein
MTFDVNPIKDQFACFLEVNHWPDFKTMAEYYLRTAATLMKKDVDVPAELKLWIRNSTKRLFVGVGCELLLKSFYLQKGYCINKPKKGLGIPSTPTHKLQEINRNNFNHRDTYTFGPLINELGAIHQFQNHGPIERAFGIAMVFRNKEGHVTFLTHDFDSQNYTDIETGIALFYQEAFGERLVFQISMEPDEPGEFRCS